MFHLRKNLALADNTQNEIVRTLIIRELKFSYSDNTRNENFHILITRGMHENSNISANLKPKSKIIKMVIQELG
jgi:hypothetical protein